MRRADPREQFRDLLLQELNNRFYRALFDAVSAMPTPDPLAGGNELKKVDPPHVPPIDEKPADRKARELRDLAVFRRAVRAHIHGRPDPEGISPP